MVKHVPFRESHGQSHTPLWHVWSMMLQRCYNENCKVYRWYGAKGVRVCKSWLRFTAFQKWAMENGYAAGLTIDRKRSSGNYSPRNCRWVTQAENNRAKAIWLITAFGETKTIGQWLEDERCKAGKESCIRQRVSRGWTHEKAISTPSRTYERK